MNADKEVNVRKGNFLGKILYIVKRSVIITLTITWIIFKVLLMLFLIILTAFIKRRPGRPKGSKTRYRHYKSIF